MDALRKPLSNVQLEILKTFSYNLDKVELSKFKDVISNYFANRAIEGANKVWKDDNWSNEKVKELLQSKSRKL